MNSELWFHVDHLAQRGERGRQALEALQSLKIFRLLQPFEPVPAGTWPIGLALPDSDLDIICEVYQPDEFIELLTRHFAHLSGWSCKRRIFQGLDSLIAGFTYNGFRIEIFAQPRPVWFQYAFRHMLVERHLLALGGSDVRDRVLELKRNGISTEEAFARVFGFEGDPYKTLYHLSFLDRDQLREQLTQISG